MVDDSKAVSTLASSTKAEKVDDDEEEKMEEEAGEEESKEEGDPVKNIKAFKLLVVSTLEKNEMLEKRACKMEIMDFLNLLKIMNEQGIHFK